MTNTQSIILLSVPVHKGTKCTETSSVVTLPSPYCPGDRVREAATTNGIMIPQLHVNHCLNSLVPYPLSFLPSLFPSPSLPPPFLFSPFLPTLSCSSSLPRPPPLPFVPSPSPHLSPLLPPSLSFLTLSSSPLSLLSHLLPLTIS